MGGNALKNQTPQGKYLGSDISKQNVKELHPLCSLLPSEGMWGCTRTPSEGSRITILKPNNLFPLEVNELIFGGVGQAATLSLGA